MQHLARSLFRIPRSAFLIPYSAFLILLACARQGAPTGGPKDTFPPVLDTAASTPNFSTRFDQKRIELKFDEWLELADAATQVIVSPPLAKRPEVLLKGKTVVVNFDKNEVLRPNTTYTLNFGTAVKDFRERNAVKNLRFVFSTGDFIDSLSFRGIVLDAFTGDAVENVSVMLYDSDQGRNADSAVRKERPYYFSRTDKTGQYEFQNLREGVFRVVAIEDSDLNLKWDGEDERIAFRDSALSVGDSMRGTVNLKLFKNRPRFRLAGQTANRYGLVSLGFNAPTDSFETKTLAPDGLKTWLERTPDSLQLWYDLPNVDTAWSLVFLNAEYGMRNAESDTIEIKKLSRSEFLKTHRLGFADVAPAAKLGRGRVSAAESASLPSSQAAKTVVQVPAKPASLWFNFPIAAFDTSRWLLSVDSNRLTAFSAMPDSANLRRFSLAFAWQQSKAHTLTLLPGALTDFWGTPNADTLRRIFNVLSEKQLGTLTLTLEKLRPGTRYVLQLLNGTVLEGERAFAAETASTKVTFNQLQVAVYTARLLEDLNGNGRWDTGDFAAQRQPERLFNKKLDALRANWEVEATLSTEAVIEKRRKQ
ncbi:MAG: Ig-like domain-containing protein [Saprospiraceae bacterium]